MSTDGRDVFWGMYVTLIDRLSHSRRLLRPLTPTGESDAGASMADIGLLPVGIFMDTSLEDHQSDMCIFSVNMFYIHGTKYCR